MQPVGKLCLYESIVDGTLDLADVALMIDTLAVRADNEALLQKLMRDGGSR